LDEVATRLRLAARAAGVSGVGLLAVPGDLDVNGLAELLDPTAADQDLRQAVHSPVREPIGVASTAGPYPPDNPDARSELRAGVAHGCPIRAYHIGQAATNGSAPGLVLVTPSTVKKTDVAAATHLLRVSPAPLLGLVTYTPPRSLVGRIRSIVRSEGVRHGR
jgi:hypothetical protein